MKPILFLLFTLGLLTSSFGQKVTVFENAPFIESAAIQQMKNFVEFENSYFYTTTNSSGDNVLVKVNKISGKVESNDQVPLGKNVSWLTATDKYIYYPYFGTTNGVGFYYLKRYDPKTNVHDFFKTKAGKPAVFTSSFIRQSALYSFKDTLIVIGSYYGLNMESEKVAYIINDSDDSIKYGVEKLYKDDSGFYSSIAPTENSLTFSNNRLYYFESNSKTYITSLRQTEGDKTIPYNFKGNSTCFPFITANDERAFTLVFDRDTKVTNNSLDLKLLEIDTKGEEIYEDATISMDSINAITDTQMNIVGDSVYISDRQYLYEYNYRLKKTTQLIKLQPNERFYNIQNGKRFHFASDGTIFYKKIAYSNRDETIGNAFIFAFDKTKSESKSLFETALAFNGDDSLKMHEATRNVYFIGNKVINFNPNNKTNKLDVLIYDKNGTSTNLPMPEIKKFKPFLDWYGKYFTAIQTKDAVVLNYGYQKNKKESKIVVMKISE